MIIYICLAYRPSFFVKAYTCYGLTAVAVIPRKNHEFSLLNVFIRETGIVESMKILKKACIELNKTKNIRRI